MLTEPYKNRTDREFLNGPVIKNLPGNAGDMGSIPGQKEDSTYHGATKPAHHNYWSLPTPGPLLYNKRSHHSEKPGRSEEHTSELQSPS